MAQASNFYPSQNVSVWFQKESTVGTEPDDAGLKKLQTTSFTIPEASVPTETSSPRSGQFVTTASQIRHNEGTKLWTFETTLKGTTTSVLLATEAVFEDSSSEAALNNDYTFPSATYTDGESSASTFDIRFVNGGADNAVETIECGGCVGTGFTLSEDIGSEGGELVCTISWATAYMPVHSATDISSAAYDTGAPKNIRSLDSDNTYINGGSNEELVVQSWELAVNRTIERIHYKDSTSGSFKPFGYAMVGNFDVTGSMTVIRNDDVHDLLAKLYDSNTVDINIQESTAGNLTIALDKCMLNESAVDNGGAVLMQTIPFTVVGADDISSSTKMLGITIAN
tara:strand:+ start:1756 stop:2775 length:1020 start_codon:yes stop_codon:yes gene_type:complete